MSKVITYQKFMVGDIVQHRTTFECYMITYVGTTNRLLSGKEMDFEFWEYIARPIGFGDGTQVPFESYEEFPEECDKCRERAVNRDTLQVVLSTGVSAEQLEGVTF